MLIERDNLIDKLLRGEYPWYKQEACIQEFIVLEVCLANHGNLYARKG